MAINVPLVQPLVAEENDLSLPAIPPLENGDRLTRAEFERRYESMPEVKKAELIERMVYMTSPVRAPHSQRHSWVNWWLVSYQLAAGSDIEVHDNVSVRLDPDNEAQPDLCLRRVSNGATRISDDGYLEGPPELIVEIAGSSASYDLHKKLHVYRRAGVQEYIVWRVYEGAIDWFRLDNGQYYPLPPNEQGVIQSDAFPGLWLNVAAMRRGDLAAVLATLQAGLIAINEAAPQDEASTDRPTSEP